MRTKDEVLEEIYQRDKFEIDEKLMEILKHVKPMCKHCYFYSPTFSGHGDCRRKAPPWTMVYERLWCGEYGSKIVSNVDSAYQRYLLETQDK